MEVICAVDIFSRSDWVAINRVRKYKGLHSIADFLLCDGRTVDPWVLSPEPSDSSPVFSVEKPTCADFSFDEQLSLSPLPHSLSLLPWATSLLILTGRTSGLSVMTVRGCTMLHQNPPMLSTERILPPVQRDLPPHILSRRVARVNVQA